MIVAGATRHIKGEITMNLTDIYMKQDKPVWFREQRVHLDLTPEPTGQCPGQKYLESLGYVLEFTRDCLTKEEKSKYGTRRDMGWYYYKRPDEEEICLVTKKRNEGYMDLREFRSFESFSKYIQLLEMNRWNRRHIGRSIACKKEDYETGKLFGGISISDEDREELLRWIRKERKKAREDQNWEGYKIVGRAGSERCVFTIGLNNPEAQIYPDTHRFNAKAIRFEVRAFEEII